MPYFFKKKPAITAAHPQDEVPGVGVGVGPRPPKLRRQIAEPSQKFCSSEAGETIVGPFDDSHKSNADLQRVICPNL